jgi:Mg2+ and Co2+ transporter CorA
LRGERLAGLAVVLAIFISAFVAASAILLPGTLLAGVMGMTFKVGVFNYSWMFWVVIAVTIAIAPLTLGFAKLRRWI